MQIQEQKQVRKGQSEKEDRVSKNLGKSNSPQQTLINFPCEKGIALCLSVLACTLINPANTLASTLGVVKSPDNTGKWTAINDRLRTLGLNYCILEQSRWETAADLNQVKVLMLPSVTKISTSQAIALTEWMKQGGRVIVTGPTATESPEQVKSQLRSLFGAYWGFVNPKAATLKPVNQQSQTWLSQSHSLSSHLRGGVIIPTSVQSQTAATWTSQAPAVVFTSNSTFLGWHWGEQSSVALDQAWLKATLKRYGIEQLSSPTLQAAACQSSQVSRHRTELIQQPVKPNLTAQEPQSFRMTYQEDVFSAQQIQEMTQELQSLIARFESTLLAAEANNLNLNSTTDKIVEESIKNRGNRPTVEANPLNNHSYKTVQEARASLKTFQQLIQQGEYTQARQLWLKARRSLWDNYPTDRQFAQPEIRAMWLDRGTIVRSRSEKELAQVFDRMAQAGINVVFFETVNASYPIYPSRIAPEQNPLTVGTDPLKAAVKLAHERGMELHAWTWIFAAANQRHNELLNQPLDYLGPVLSRNPDWAMRSRQGGVFDYSDGYKKAFFDPANPNVQNYLMSLLEEIVMNYDVDGVQFDYIRYPFQAPNKNQIMGYSDSSRWLFKEMTGVDPVDIGPSHPLWGQWTGFRLRQVDNFVANASARLKQRRPNLIISAAVFPMERRERMFRLQQNWEEWGQNNWVDLIFLMTYAMDTGSFEERIQPLQNPNSAGASLVIPGLRLLKVPDPVTLDQMQLVRNLPTGGFALFAAENLTTNLQEIFSRTQGSLNEPLPHRQPFQSVAARFQSLQKEWSFLLVNNQLTMDERHLKEWGKQVDALAVAFKQLAEKPTSSNYSHAKTSLARFRRQFKTWMRGYQRLYPYQVEVWENRLETLDRILKYGDRYTAKRRM